MSEKNGPKFRAQPGFDEEFQEILAKWSDLARRMFLEKPHSRDVVRSMPAFEARVELPFSGRPEEMREQAQELYLKLSAHIDDAILNNAAFRPGFAYCFFCERADCEHASPNGPRAVFGGYSELGTPLWPNFLDWAIERKIPEVDELAKDHGVVVQSRIDREALIGQRLKSFSGKERSYDLRGQLALGFYRSQKDGERFAVTLQIVRTATRSRVVRLGLNVLGVLPSGESAEACVAAAGPYDFVDLVRQADRRLAAINQELKSCERKSRMNRAAELADKLLLELSQGFGATKRRRGWRTEHAVKRADQGDRPTGKARDDVAQAKPDRVFYDGRKETYVVLGPKGRTHVFAADGRHVTSLKLQRWELDSRIKKKRWQALSDAEVGALLQLIRHTLKMKRGAS